MSKIVSDETECKGISHVVETEDGKCYAVSSIENTLPYLGTGYETMVFKWNRKLGKITDWFNLLCFKHGNETEMLQDHMEICSHLESHLYRSRRRMSNEF